MVHNVNAKKWAKSMLKKINEDPLSLTLYLSTGILGVFKTRDWCHLERAGVDDTPITPDTLATLCRVLVFGEGNIRLYRLDGAKSILRRHDYLEQLSAFLINFFDPDDPNPEDPNELFMRVTENEWGNIMEETLLKGIV